MNKQYIIIIISFLAIFGCKKINNNKLEGEYTAIFTTKGHKFQNEFSAYLVDTLTIDVDKVYKNTLNWNQSILNRENDSIYGVFSSYKESFANYIQINGVVDVKNQTFNGYFEYLDSSYVTGPPGELINIFNYGEFNLKKN